MRSLQYVFYVLGILILTLGISITIQSDLGTSPFDALLVGLSKEVGLTIGSWEIIIAFIFIICNSILKRQVPEFSGLITAFITGIGIDVWLLLMEHLVQPEIWFSKLLCFGAGLIISSIGTAMYLYTNFAPIPVDRFMLILRELTNMNITLTKTFIYLLFLTLAFTFDGPIGIGTLLTVCFGGLILNYFMPIIDTLLIGFSVPNHSTKRFKNENHSM